MTLTESDEISQNRDDPQDNYATGRALAPLRQAWNDLPELKLNARRMARARIVAATRRDPTHMAVDMLRTRLMDVIRKNGWHTLGITSPRGGCGKTTLAINLALSFTQQSDFRVGLLDLDLRRPAISRVLRCEQPGDIEGFLRGYRPMAQSLVRYRHNLAIAPNSVPVLGAAELLIDCIPSEAISQMQQALDLDLLIYDLPPMLAADDALAILPSIDAMLLVAAAGETRLSEIDSCERDLSLHGKFAGLVLNKCRYVPDRYGY
jgi:Mrp family chromosome partitioning ATPase